MLTKRILIPYFSFVVLLLIALIYKDIFIDVDIPKVREVTLDKLYKVTSLNRSKPSNTTINNKTIINTNNKIKVYNTPNKSKIIVSKIQSQTPEKTIIISIQPTIEPSINPSINPTLEPTFEPLPTISNQIN